MSYLELSGISKRFGDFTALRDVNLSAQKGEFVTFLGPSGSGKTTTLMIVAGFERATEGDVRIDGASLSGLAPHERNIGIVFQNYGLFPHKTAAENVWFPLQMRGMGKRPGLARAREMLDLVGLADFGHRHPKELSGGQQQRVALARALVFEPSLLLLDEPLGALDKSLREQMQIEIKRVQRALGVTTVFVTHDQSEAMSMSDRIVVFDKGAIQQADTPLELYHRPKTRFVASFIGESNLIPARVDYADPQVAHSDLTGRIRVENDAMAQGACLLLVRPEQVELARPDAPGAIPLRIETLVHYGDSTLVLGSASGQPIRARVSGRRAAGLSEGTDCHIRFGDDAAFVIADEG